MRIAFYGNICNNFYAVARALRTGSVDAHLYIDEDAAWTQLPESDDPSLLRGYPDWIHRGRYRTVQAVLWPARSPLLNELRTHDLVMVSGHGVQLAPFVGRPVVFYTSGWDITGAPFPLRNFSSRTEPLIWRMYGLLAGVWQRRGIAAVWRIWTQPFTPFQTALRRLGVPNEKVVPAYLPIIIDTAVFRRDPNARSSADPNVRRMVDHHDFVIFHPSSILTDTRQPLVDAGQWKGNDLLIEGFARFVAANPGSRPALVMIDRPSPGRAAAKRQIATLGIESHVVWLKPTHAYGFDRSELLPFYSVADVVADEFGVGWFGSIVVEGTSMGAPVLCYLDEAVMSRLYPWHPILTPRTPDEIAATLTQLYRDPAERTRRGEMSRRWAEEFHSLDRAGARYAEQLLRALGSRS